jgi:hypothetical protein
MAEFGISVPDEVADYWLQHLNDRMVDLDTLASYLGRLADLFISPAYAITGPLERLRAMPEGELRAFLHDSSSHWWRRILVGIGLVLRHREQFSPAAVQAAHEALQVWPPR